MASEGERAQERSFKELLRVDGETLRFRAKNLTAIVDRNPDTPTPIADDEVRFDERNQATVEFLRSAVSKVPAPGEYLSDADERRIRILWVTRTRLTYFCHVKIEE